MKTQLELVELIKINAYNTYRATLIAGPKFTQDLFKELSNPKPGDLVMEVTTHRMKNRDPFEGIGRLVGVGYAPLFATAAGYGPDEKIPERKVWDITLDFDDGRAFRWENASFIKVKEDLV
jgi:hypothetical protein